MNDTEPSFVSVLTPVYNGAEFLAECIESVLAQTYTNWDYTIVNNCSTDETLAIAQKYAARDSRIRVVTNDRFRGIVENHNHTARMISPNSKYCKFVFADDWLYPNCLSEMVGLAEQNPSVGLVGAYTIDGCSVRWHGPPFPSRRVSGREMCRRQLLGGPYVFGTMTSLLVRCDLIRKRERLFNEQHLQPDLELCFDLLQESDFGFLHQVLSFSRERQGADFFSANINSHRLADFIIFLKYGRALLDAHEYERRWKRVRWDYHRVLAHNVLRFRPKEFWQYHNDVVESFGGQIDRWLLAQSVIAEVASQLVHPLSAFRRGRRWWSGRVRRADGERVARFQKSKSESLTGVEERRERA
jgi:glycosyltransferase involved in cell wall biosynthesis